MVLTRRQSQLFIKQFNNININQQDQMAAKIKYLFVPFEKKINPGDPT